MITRVGNASPPTPVDRRDRLDRVSKEAIEFLHLLPSLKVGEAIDVPGKVSAICRSFGAMCVRASRDSDKPRRRIRCVQQDKKTVRVYIIG